MRTRISSVFVAVIAIGLPAAVAVADVTSDRPAAILVFPHVVASRVSGSVGGTALDIVTDTLIQISNTANEPARLHCFYVNATGYCSATGGACDPNPDVFMGCPSALDICIPRWAETDFDIHLTPRQPLAWRASKGLLRDDLPLDGSPLRGPSGDSNAGTLVPPVRLREGVPDSPPIHPSFEASIFTGELKCIVVDASGRGAASNIVKGEATVTTAFTVTSDSGGTGVNPQTSRYNAIGILAIDGDANGDGVLELGGGANEYNGCPQVLIVQHFFDGARLLGPFEVSMASELTLVPCTQNFRAQIPGSVTAQYLVFNEFEQRFSTSARVDCLFDKVLSKIDTRHGERSIFRIGVAGTLSGQTRIRGVGGGLLGVLTEKIDDDFEPGYQAGLAAINLALQGDREQPDFITVP